jgi:protein-S-isoprenylcysteine O-methyltransferase Ste14
VRERRISMSGLKKALYRLNPWLLSSVGGGLLVLQIALCVFWSNPQGVAAVRYAGYVLWAIAVVFAMLPIFTLRRRGGVAQGQSYMKTTTLVTTGVYSLVRHPQGGLAWLLMNLAVILVGQTWPITLLGAISMILAYLDTFKTDRYCVEKFGQEYERYMESVPRVNVVLGIIRLLRKRREAGHDQSLGHV